MYLERLLEDGLLCAATDQGPEDIDPSGQLRRTRRNDLHIDPALPLTIDKEYKRDGSPVIHDERHQHGSRIEDFPHFFDIDRRGLPKAPEPRSKKLDLRTQPPTLVDEPVERLLDGFQAFRLALGADPRASGLEPSDLRLDPDLFEPEFRRHPRRDPGLFGHHGAQGAVSALFDQFECLDRSSLLRQQDGKGPVETEVHPAETGPFLLGETRHPSSVLDDGDGAPPERLRQPGAAGPGENPPHQEETLGEQGVSGKEFRAKIHCFPSKAFRRLRPPLIQGDSAQFDQRSGDPFRPGRQPPFEDEGFLEFFPRLAILSHPPQGDSEIVAALGDSRTLRLHPEAQSERSKMVITGRPEISLPHRNVSQIGQDPGFLRAVRAFFVEDFKCLFEPPSSLLIPAGFLGEKTEVVRRIAQLPRRRTDAANLPQFLEKQFPCPVEVALLERDKPQIAEKIADPGVVGDQFPGQFEPSAILHLGAGPIGPVVGDDAEQLPGSGNLQTPG